MKRNKVIVGTVILALVILANWPSRHHGPASIAANVTHFYTNSFNGTEILYGNFILSNSSLRRVRCRGVGASFENQFVSHISKDGGMETNFWLTPGSASYILVPGETRKVALEIKTNIPFKVGFRCRETAFADYCPWFIWNWLPDKYKRIPEYHEFWTEQISPPPISKIATIDH